MNHLLKRIQSSLTTAAVIVAGCAMLTSCYKDAPLGSECDILRAKVSVAAPAEMFYNLSDTTVEVLSTDSTVTFTVRNSADLSALAPTFDITKGSVISPASGSVHDFSNGPVTYTVTSENKTWHRTYRVAFNRVTRSINDTTCLDFEHFSLESSGHKYYVWQRLLEDGTLSSDWGTGNAGFNLSMGSAKPNEYPTVPDPDGIDGYCARLTTRSTGPFGEMYNKRIAAGNLFLGSFDMASVLINPLKATRFGVPYDASPLKFTGYYKYTPGPKFIDKSGREIVGRTDSAAVYAVFYRNHDADGNAMVLYGDNVKTSPLVVAIADTKYLAPTTEWTPFEVTFTYLSEPDARLLAERGYSLAVVFSSSSEGDKFMGAVGSCLMVDKVRIISTKEE